MFNYWFPVTEWQSSAAILENGRHFDFFAWQALFSEQEGYNVYVYQFWCLYPEVNDSTFFWLLSALLLWYSAVIHPATWPSQHCLKRVINMLGKPALESVSELVT